MHKSLDATLGSLISVLAQRCVASPRGSTLAELRRPFLFRDVVLFRFDGQDFVLQDEALVLYRSLTRALWADPKVGGIASLAAVQKATKEMLRAALSDEQGKRRRQPTEYLAQLRAGLAAQVQEWTVVAPVVGVQVVEQAPVSLGAVRLAPVDSVDGTTLRCRMMESIVQRPSAAAISDELRGQLLTAPVNPELYDTCVIATDVDAADPEQALNVGLATSREFLAALQVFLFAVYRDPLMPRIGIPPNGDMPDPQLPRFRASALGTGEHWASGYTGYARVTSPCIVDAATLDRMNLIGWSVVDAIWKEGGNASKWRRTLRSAARWLGDALADENRGASFAKFTTVLEMLLAQDGHSRKIRGPLARRLAFLLAQDTGDRERMERQAKKLYDTRCGIVHYGYSGVIEEELDAMRSFSIDVFLSLLTRSYEIDSFEKLTMLSRTGPGAEAECQS